MRNFFIPIILLTVGFVTGFLTSKFSNHRPQHISTIREIITDTVIIHDTCHIVVKKPVETIQVRYITRYLPVDSGVTSCDSMAVRLPITRKVYTDSMYHAVVSGYEPHLDSITIFPIRQSITRTVTPTIMRPSVTSRWGIGLTAGAALTPRGVSPAISIGVTYNFLTF